MAFHFKGVANHYLELGKAVLNTTNYPFTMCCWFWGMLVSGTSDLALVSISTSNDARNWILGTRANGDDLQVRASQHSGGNSFSPNSVKANGTGWNHAAGWFESNASRTGFLNGMKGTTNTSNLITFTPDRTNIGAVYDSGIAEIFKGHIADVAIWNQKLSIVEIQALANGFARPGDIRPGALVIWCPLEYDRKDIAKNNYFTSGGANPVQSWPFTNAPRFLGKQRGNSRARANSNPTLNVGVTVQTYNVAIAEAMALADSINAGTTIPEAITEAMVLTDSISDLAVLSASLTETMNLQDHIDATGGNNPGSHVVSLAKMTRVNLHSPIDQRKRR